VSAEVVVTGIGVHSALGDGPATLHALAAQPTALALRTPEDAPGFPPLPAAPAADALDPEALPDPKLLKYMSPVTRLAVLAAGRALADAGLAAAPDLRARTGLMLATGLIAFDVGGVRRAIDASLGPAGQLDMERLGRAGLRRCNPLMPFRMLLNMPLGMVSIVHGLRGSNLILYPDALQAVACFEAAARALRHGRAERVLVGGATQGVSLLPLGTWRRAGWIAATPTAAQPFAAAHAGWGVGDGAAFVLLERADAARARRARVRARFVGAALRGPGAPPPPAAPAALWRALGRDAAPDLALCCGLLEGAADRAEAAGWAEGLGAPVPPLASCDGALGQLSAAGPAMALALALEARAQGAALPPQLGAGPLPARWGRLSLQTAEPSAGRGALALVGAEE